MRQVVVTGPVRICLVVVRYVSQRRVVVLLGLILPRYKLPKFAAVRLPVFGAERGKLFANLNQV